MLLTAIASFFTQIVYAISVPQSPCPLFFNYESVISGGTVGVVRIPTDSLTLPITLNVQLVIRVALKTKYVGILMLSENPTLVLGKLLTSKPKTVNYTIRFPLPSPLPFLQKIEVNNRTLCTGEEITSVGHVFGGVMTNILLEHTFPAVQSSLTNKISDDIFPGMGDGLRMGRDSECWRTKSRKIDLNNRWPWLAAVFIKDESGLNFQCAGSLITDRHIVTAAHCITNHKNKSWDKNNFEILFGNHDINNVEDLHSQVRQVDNIIIHPEYNNLNYIADIAVLVFKAVDVNEYVRPVCIWNRGTSLKPLIGYLGTVVGWGLDGTTRKIKKKPDVYQLPIVDQAECLRSRKEFLYITSERTLCAGLRNGTGPCSGDSGSGLLILSNNRNSFTWYLRGLISLSLLDKNQNTCDLNEYLVFTDIARFKDWLKNVT